MFKGSIVAIVTPLKPNGSLDKSTFKRLLNWHLIQGTHGVVVNGTTGESSTLTQAERYQLLEIAVEICSKHIPVIAGTGTSSTHSTLEETQLAEKIGVSGALLVTPYYNRPTQNGLLEHYKTVAEASNLPLILYNVPNRTACDLLPDTVGKLSKISTIIGIKEATGDISRVQQLIEHCGDQFLLFSGDDKSALAFLKAGGHGIISVTANVVPNAMAKLCELSKINPDSAKMLHSKLSSLHQALMVESNPIPIKWLLHKMGRIKKGIRLPLTELSTKHHLLLQAAFTTAQTNQSLNKKSCNTMVET